MLEVLGLMLGVLELILGVSGLILVILGTSWRSEGTFLRQVEESRGQLGANLRQLGSMLVDFGEYVGLCWGMLGHLEPSYGQPFAYMRILQKPAKTFVFLRFLAGWEVRVEAKLGHLGAKLEYLGPCLG